MGKINIEEYLLISEAEIKSAELIASINHFRAQEKLINVLSSHLRILSEHIKKCAKD